MTITEGHLAAWEVTAAVLQEIEREGLERLSGVVDSARLRRARLARLSGSFDYEATLQSVAEKIYTVTVACIKDTAPKLFEAAPEAGKDAAKKMVERRLKAPEAAPGEPRSAGPARIRELVRLAALERKLNAEEADAIGDAVVARLLADAPGGR